MVQHRVTNQKKESSSFGKVAAFAILGVGAYFLLKGKGASRVTQTQGQGGPVLNSEAWAKAAREHKAYNEDRFEAAQKSWNFQIDPEKFKVEEKTHTDLFGRPINHDERAETYRRAFEYSQRMRQAADPNAHYSSWHQSRGRVAMDSDEFVEAYGRNRIYDLLATPDAQNAREILDIPPTSRSEPPVSLDQLKKAYQIKALASHPDTRKHKPVPKVGPRGVQEDENAEFLRVQAAYELLSKILSTVENQDKKP